MTTGRINQVTISNTGGERVIPPALRRSMFPWRTIPYGILQVHLEVSLAIQYPIQATRFHPHKSLAPSDWPEPTFRATGETDTTSLRRAASILQVFKAKFNHRWSIHFSVLHTNPLIRKCDLPGSVPLLMLLVVANVPIFSY